MNQMQVVSQRFSTALMLVCVVVFGVSMSQGEDMLRKNMFLNQHVSLDDPELEGTIHVLQEISLQPPELWGRDLDQWRYAISPASATKSLRVLLLPDDEMLAKVLGDNKHLRDRSRAAVTFMRYFAKFFPDVPTDTYLQFIRALQEGDYIAQRILSHALLIVLERELGADAADMNEWKGKIVELAPSSDEVAVRLLCDGLSNYYGKKGRGIFFNW